MLVILLFQFICTQNTGSVCGKRKRWNQHFSLQPIFLCMLQLGQQIVSSFRKFFVSGCKCVYTSTISAWTYRYLFWHCDSNRFFFLFWNTSVQYNDFNSDFPVTEILKSRIFWFICRSFSLVRTSCFWNWWYFCKVKILFTNLLSPFSLTPPTSGLSKLGLHCSLVFIYWLVKDIWSQEVIHSKIQDDLCVSVWASINML